MEEKIDQEEEIYTRIKECKREYIDKKNYSERVASSLYAWGEWLISRGRIEWGAEGLSLARECYEKLIEIGTSGGNVWLLEKRIFSDKSAGYKILDDYYKVLKAEAQIGNFDSYLLYLEKNREPSERFYRPKREHFIRHGIIQGFQDLIDDKLDILSISMPPGTQKTTVLKFFMSMVIGLYPKDYSLFYSHSAGITRMFYDGCLDIVTSDEYTWNEIFPDLSITSQNAKSEQFNVGKYKPFPSVQCTSVGAQNAGRLRCNKFLLCDDLIGSIEQALNNERLDTLWTQYTTDGKQRKLDGCKEIHIATRWSVRDVIGRLKTIYAGNDRCRFIAIPDIDPTTGKSNFDYEYLGFSVEFFNDIALTMDDISYRCLYKNEPIEREGLLYHDDELRRYMTLPLEEPDAIIGICDTKAKGTDFFVLPCMYKYGEDYYMVDTICNNSSDFGLQYEKMSNLILNYNMQQCEFESNTGGDRVAYEVQKLVDKAGGRCNITTKPTESNKETKIIVNSDWVKKHVVFRDKTLYNAKDDYGVFMSNLLAYSVVGKNAHDDVPDALAMFCLYVTRGARVSVAQAIQNPFRGNYYGGY